VSKTFDFDSNKAPFFYQ